MPGLQLGKEQLPTGISTPNEFYPHTNPSTYREELNNDFIFESMHLAHEDNAKLDLTRLEQESNRMMESIAKMDLKLRER